MAKTAKAVLALVTHRITSLQTKAGDESSLASACAHRNDPKGENYHLGRANGFRASAVELNAMMLEAERL